jgi:hopanoid C-3 methylase
MARLVCLVLRRQRRTFPTDSSARPPHRVYEVEAMNVSFVSHPCPALLDEDGVAFGPVRTNFFPQPQLTLASALDRSRYHLELLDLRTIADPRDWRSSLGPQYDEPIRYGKRWLSRHLIGAFEEKIAASSRDVDVYVLSANFTYEANAVRECIRALKQHNPGALVLVGGSDATPVERREFYWSCGADYVGVGDGDRSLRQFLESHEVGTAAKDFLQKIVTGPGQIHVMDIEACWNGVATAPAWCESGGGDLLPSVRNRGFAAYVETQRGCNRSCSFCSAALTRFDRLSVPDVKRQVDVLVAAGASMLMFTDDNTLLRSKDELVEIFDYLRERGVAWEFPNGLELGLMGTKDAAGQWRPHVELCDALFWHNHRLDAFAGAHRVLLPIEDALLRQSELLKLKRGSVLDAVDDVFMRDIPFINCGIMTGAPHETATERRLLERNLRSLAEHAERAQSRINFSVFCTMPLPGTGFGTEMHRAGRVAYDMTTFPELWNIFVSVVQGDSSSPEENTAYRRQILKEFGMEQVEGKVAGKAARAIPPELLSGAMAGAGPQPLAQV